MLHKIYLVKGETGAWSEFRSWDVAAFKTEASAQKLVKQATQRAQTIHKLMDKLGIGSADQSRDKRLVNQFDLRMEMDFTGTTYDYKEISYYDH